MSRQFRQIGIDQLEPSPLRSGPLPAIRVADLAIAERQGLDVFPPVVAREVFAGRYEILIGIRTWLMAQRIGVEDVSTVIVETQDEHARELVEADTSHERNMVHVAKELRELVERAGISKAEAGRRYGLSRSEVSNRIRLLALSPEVLDKIAKDEIKPGHARALIGLPVSVQVDIAKRAARDGLSVRQVEQLAKTRKSGGAPPAEQPAPTVEKDPVIRKIEEDLSRLLGNAVTITQTEGRWKLAIECYDLDGVEGVLERLGYNPDTFDG